MLMFISSDKNIMISLGIWTAAFKLIGILTMMTFNGRFYRISKKDEKQSIDSIQSCIPVYCQPIMSVILQFSLITKVQCPGHYHMVLILFRKRALYDNKGKKTTLIKTLNLWVFSVVNNSLQVNKSHL